MISLHTPCVAAGRISLAPNLLGDQVQVSESTASRQVISNAPEDVLAMTMPATIGCYDGGRGQATGRCGRGKGGSRAVSGECSQSDF